MKIWIDIVNSPHAHFFRPIIGELRKRGHSIRITARRYAQTTGLLKEFQIPFTLIGAHAGPRISSKVADIFMRSAKLYTYAKSKKIDLALAFNSPSLALAAKVLRIPSIGFMDYEYQPLNHFTFRLYEKIITPTIFPDDCLKRYGALHKVIKISGLKEQVYLSDFRPTPIFLDLLGVNKNKIIVTARPPATMALYHRFENHFFYEIISYLLKNKDVVVVVIPRSLKQKEFLLDFKRSNLIILERTVDGRNLLYYSDLVIGAGGTMNREAAVLGTPAYTIFKGKMGAVDKYLIKLGRIVDLTKNFDLRLIKLEKKKKVKPLVNKRLLPEIVNKILSISERDGWVSL